MLGQPLLALKMMSLLSEIELCKHYLLCGYSKVKSDPQLFVAILVIKITITQMKHIPDIGSVYFKSYCFLGDIA